MSAIAYSIESLDQIRQLELSLKSIPNQKINVYIFASKKIAISNFSFLQKEAGKKDMLSLKIIHVQESIPGMFYWFLYPFYLNEEKIFHIDNDTLIKNVKFKSIKSRKNVFTGARGHFYKEKENAKIIKYFRNDKKLYDKYKSKYINTGVVLINSPRYKSNFTKDGMLFKIDNFVKECKINNLAVMDQEFLSIYFPKHISFFSHKYNLRLNNKIATIIYSNNRKLIYHYCIKSEFNGKIEKMDFSKLSASNNTQTLETLYKRHIKEKNKNLLYQFYIKKAIKYALEVDNYE